MPISVCGGPGVGFYARMSHVNKKSKENQRVPYKAIKCACVCAPFMYCLCFHLCLDKYACAHVFGQDKNRAERNEREFFERREGDRQREGW